MTPDLGSLSRRLLGRYWPHFNVEHCTFFSRQSIHTILEANGFEVLDYRPFRKALNLHYIKAQIDSHGRPLLKRVVDGFLFCVPKALWKRNWFFLHGEMLVIARKTTVV